MKKIITLLSLLPLLCMSLHADWNPRYTIDFVAAYDPDGAEYAREKCGTIQAFSELVVNKMNTVMQNSNINGKFRLVGTYTTHTNIPDVGRWGNIVLNDFDLQDYVTEKEGDVCLVFAGCKGSSNHETGNATFRARPGMQYGCVLASSAYDANTAVHEAGHIMGCAHAYDMDGGAAASGDTCTYCYAAERTTSDGHTMSTVMGYHGELIPYFSSPTLYYKGVQMGSDHEDNCRVLNTRMPIISTLGDKRTNFWLSQTEFNVSSAAQTTTFFIEGTKAWRITTDASDWISTNMTQGGTDADITVSIKANKTGKERVGHITVSDWDADNPEYKGDILGSTTVTIIQNPEGYTPPNPGEEVKARGISVAPKESELALGKTLQLTVTLTPANVTNKVVHWISDDEKIATVSTTGLVTPIKEGETVIMVETTDGSNLGDMCVVKVVKGSTPPSPGPNPPGPETKNMYAIQLNGSSLYFSTKTVADHSATTFSLSATPELFTLEPDTKGGSTAYYITSTNGTQVGHSQLNTWDFSDNSSLWYIDNIEGLPTTILKNKGEGFGVDNQTEGAGVYTDKKDGTLWRFIAQQTTGIVVTGLPTEESQKIYDLQGRRIQSPRKGLYIQSRRVVLH